MNANKKIKWLGVLLCLALQPLAIFYARRLAQRNEETLFFSGEGLESYRQFLEHFKEQKLVLVKVQFSSELEEARYQEFRRATRALGEEFPDAAVLTFADLYRFFLKQDDLKAAREFAAQKPGLQLQFLGPDYLVFLVAFGAQSQPEEIQSFFSRLRSREFFQGQKLQIAGLPYINYLLDQYSRDIKTQVFPLLFAVVFLVTLAFTRSLLTALILFIPALGSLSLTLALIQGLYGSMNMVTSIVPLLIFVLNLSLAFHFYFTFLEYGSMRRALQEKKVPFLLMVATTAIGFGSLGFSDIPAIRQFGILSFPAILVSAALTFLWAYSTFPWRIEQEPRNLLAWIPSRPFLKTWSRRSIFLLSLFLLPASLLAFPKIPLSTDATSYFPKKSGLQESIRELESELMGIPIVELDLTKRAPGEFSYEELLALDSLEHDILREFGGKRRIISADQVVEEANYLYTGEKKLPPFELSYQTLRSQTLPLFQIQYPSSSHYRLTVFGPTMDYQPYQEELGRLKKILDRYPQFKAVNGGVYYQIMQAQSSLILILTASFILRLLVMAALFYLYFRNLRLLLVFLVSNEMPILACVLFLYLCHFSLNVATVMVFPIAVGIVVGNTFHIIDALAKGMSPNPEEYFNTIVIPVLIGTLALVFGFAILGFYGFVPIRQFGMALAFTVLLGMFSALYIVPTLVTKTTDLRGFLSPTEGSQ